ncbi:MAG: DUF58 domain-containing protein [Treponema sp.]|nr:DUF58 domain-containing protein [Treponema sp.]
MKRSMVAKPVKFKSYFIPRTMGVFVLLIIILSFTAGAIRHEMVLTLTGSVFMVVWVYCLTMTLLLALIHRRRAGSISICLHPEKIIEGDQVQIILSEVKNSTFALLGLAGKNFPDTAEPRLARNKNFLQFPGILVRCRLLLCTKDGRRIAHDFKPERKSGFSQIETIQVKKRGAYYSPNDEFMVFDILGFFRFICRIPVSMSVPDLGAQNLSARLLVSPLASGDPPPILAKGGESKRQDSPPIERTDEFIDHRPYVPGDDPRRINWKLYSHGGELFVRQGRREPPPHSNITILIDTQFDSLYTVKSARAAADVLCENALAIINSAVKGRNIQVGFTGQSEKSCISYNQAELGFYLAYPWAQASVSQMAGFPSVPNDSAIVILAMPRRLPASQPFALDHFLSDNPNRSIELIFICEAREIRHNADEMRAEAAQSCVSFYNRLPGVRASIITCNQTGGIH